MQTRNAGLWLAVVGLLGCGQEAGHSSDGSAADLSVPGVDAGACGATPSLRLTPVASGLHSPTFVTGVSGDSTRLFVLERGGTIQVVQGGAPRATPFLDLSAQVTSGGDDDGLLGLAFHPQYATNDRFFVDYTDTNHNLVVAEFARSSADAASPTVVKTFLTIANSALIRYGGMLAFGRDGYLYIGVGDGAPDGDPSHNALNLSLQLGKLLRIDVDHFPTPPAGNMTGANVDPQIWDYGLRQPWRFSFDRQTGELYLADVGHPTYQEINIEPPGSGGHNYGWSTLSGSHCTQPNCDQTGVTAPVAEYSGAGSCAVIGGYVYRGTKNACLTGWYLYADYCSKHVRALSWNGTTVATTVDLTQSLSGVRGQPASFGEDADGELYFVDYGRGTVSRIDPQ